MLSNEKCLNCGAEIARKRLELPYWCINCIDKAEEATGLDAFNIAFQAWNAEAWNAHAKSVAAERRYKRGEIRGYGPIPTNSPDPIRVTLAEAGMFLPVDAEAIRRRERYQHLLANTTGPETTAHLERREAVASALDELMNCGFSEEAAKIFMAVVGHRPTTADEGRP